MRRLLSVLLVGLTLTASVGVSEASAPGLWSSPTLLASNTGPSLPASAVQSENGQSVAAWASGTGVFTAIAGTDRRFGAPLPLTDHSIGNDQSQILAMDRRGDAIVMWERDKCDTPQSCPMVGSLFASYRPAHGQFGPIHMIAADAGRAVVGIDGHGNATIAWDQSDGDGHDALDVIGRQADGRYGPEQTIATGMVGLGGLAVNAGGQAVISWASGSPTAAAVLAATRPAGGRFGTTVTVVSTKDGGGREPGAAIDARGVATISWEGPYDGAASGMPFKHVEVSSFAVGASQAGPIQVLEAPGTGRLGDDGPLLYENAHGDALVAWQNATNQVVVARRRAGRRFAPAEAVGDSYAGGSLAAGIGAAGQAIVSWDSLAAPVQAVIADSAGRGFGRPSNVAPRRQTSAVPAVAIDGSRATAVWWDIGSAHKLQYATIG
jgi:hypothetical protein